MEFTPLGDSALLLRLVPSARQIEENGGELLREAQVFDVYTGTPIPEGQKSVAVALRFQSDERTLRDEEVEAFMLQLRQAATRELGANLR